MGITVNQRSDTDLSNRGRYENCYAIAQIVFHLCRYPPLILSKDRPQHTHVLYVSTIHSPQTELSQMDKSAKQVGMWTKMKPCDLFMTHRVSSRQTLRFWKNTKIQEAAGHAVCSPSHCSFQWRHIINFSAALSLQLAKEEIDNVMYSGTIGWLYLCFTGIKHVLFYFVLFQHYILGGNIVLFPPLPCECCNS